MSQKIEQSVNRVGVALGGLLKAFETAGPDITEDDVKKVFDFLGMSFATIQQQALLARTAGLATQGKFSLGMTLPSARPSVLPTAPISIPMPALMPPVLNNPPTTITFTPQEPVADDDELRALTSLDYSDPSPPPARTTTRKKPREWREPEGRLVGSKEVVFAPEEEPEKPKPRPVDPREVPDPKHGGIDDAGFIDD